MLTVLGLSMVGLKVAGMIVASWLLLMLVIAMVAPAAVLDRAALKTEFAQLHKDNGDLFAKAQTEKRALTAEETEQKTARFARMDSIQQLVADHDKNAALAFASGEADAPDAPVGKPKFDADRGGDEDGEQKFDAKGYKKAVNHFARTGDTSLIQKFAVVSTTASGVLVPTQVLPPVAIRRSPNAVRRLMGYFGVEPIRMNDASNINLPVGNDTANIAATQTEGTATAGTDTAPTYTGTLALSGANSNSSKPMWFSNTQVSNFAFDVFGYALPILQKRIEKKQESDWTTSLVAGTIGKTLASASAITYAEWLAYEHSLPQEYRDDAGHILSDSLFQLLRGLVDSNGRPIMDIAPTDTFQYQVHGKPIVVGQYLAAVATTAIVGVYASAECLKVLDAMQPRLVRYVNVPSQPDNVGFELFQNGDFKFITNGVRTLKMG